MDLYIDFLSNLKIVIISINSINMIYMVLYMHSVPLYLPCLFIKLKKNLILRAKLSNSYIENILHLI